MDGRCLVCGKYRPLDRAHWPKSKATGGTSIVPLCRECHDAQHWGDASTIDLLIDRAPDYWRSVGEWEAARVAYWRWLDRRAYLEAVNG